jgi:hypothetical protein
MLSGLSVRDEALKANGSPPLGDLTNALDFSQPLAELSPGK